MTSHAQIKAMMLPAQKNVVQPHQSRVRAQINKPNLSEATMRSRVAFAMLLQRSTEAASLVIFSL